MDDEELARQQPHDIHEALTCMKTALDVFTARRTPRRDGRRGPDKRAIFVHVYYEMTKEVRDAVLGTGAYAGQEVFLDPDWVARLSGLFASLYFRSITFTGPEEGVQTDRAWKAANRVARDRESGVLINALLGINAHINKDLAEAIAENLKPEELGDPAALHRRKFDHDQVNNMLMRAMPRIQDILGRRYGAGVAIGDRLMGSLDERLSGLGLSHYRERVWWDAVTFASAKLEGREHVVRAKLDWESHKAAQVLERQRWVWQVERALGHPVVVLTSKGYLLVRKSIGARRLGLFGVERGGNTVVVQP